MQYISPREKLQRWWFPKTNNSKQIIKCWLCGKRHRLIKCNQFLQIIPVTLINGERSIKANAILDTRLDSMFITTGIAKQLRPKGIDQEIYVKIFLLVCSVLISTTKIKNKKIQFNLVNLDIFSNLNFAIFKIKNACVVNSMKLPPK